MRAFLTTPGKAGFGGLLTTCLLLLSLNNCAKDNPSKPTPPKTDNSTRWDFDDLNGWVDGSQNTGGPHNYAIIDTVLRIHTRAGTRDRAKVHTTGKIYASGAYTWSVYLPIMGSGDQASIGAFLYNSDTHELDFEIGYGTTADRKALSAEYDDLICYTTSQANPRLSTKRTIKRDQWYKLSIVLDLVGGANGLVYQATWKIDGETIEQVELTFGAETLFYIFCSVENLTFLGDHVPHQENYALFDYVEYRP